MLKTFKFPNKLFFYKNQKSIFKNDSKKLFLKTKHALDFLYLKNKMIVVY